MVLEACCGAAHRPCGIDLENRPIIITVVAGALEQPMPHVRLSESLGREHLVEKRGSLVIVAVGVDLDVAASGRLRPPLPARSTADEVSSSRSMSMQLLGFAAPVVQLKVAGDL